MGQRPESTSLQRQFTNVQIMPFCERAGVGKPAEAEIDHCWSRGGSARGMGVSADGRAVSAHELEAIELYALNW